MFGVSLGDDGGQWLIKNFSKKGAICRRSEGGSLPEGSSSRPAAGLEDQVVPRN